MGLPQLGQMEPSKRYRWAFNLQWRVISIVFLQSRSKVSSAADRETCLLVNQLEHRLG